MRLQILALFAVLVALISCAKAAESHIDEADLKARNVEEEGYIDISVGVRMKRDESTLEKRSEFPPSTPLLLRRSPETGKIIWPGSFSEALTMAKRDVPSMLLDAVQRPALLVRRSMSVAITWYTGHDLLFPSCFPDSDEWAPTDDSMIAATTIYWPGKPKCGSFVRIHHLTKKHKSIVVRVVDSCGGCPPGKPHLDLSKAAFEKLYDEDVGYVDGLKAKVIPCPARFKEDWNEDIIDLYGPQHPIKHNS